MKKLAILLVAILATSTVFAVTPPVSKTAAFKCHVATALTLTCNVQDVDLGEFPLNTDDIAITANNTMEFTISGDGTHAISYKITESESAGTGKAVLTIDWKNNAGDPITTAGAWEHANLVSGTYKITATASKITTKAHEDVELTQTVQASYGSL